jgi:zinc/manganese transport system ATP-binding protein
MVLRPMGFKMDNHSKHIQIQHLTVAYGETVALENISGTLHPNALMALFGPNGGGKSTFVNVLASIIKPTSGTITHQCRTTCSPAYLPQQSTMHRQFPLTVREVVAMGLWGQAGPFHALDPGHQEKIDEALERVGLQDYDQRLIGTLSGGQFQRMLFARIILEDSSLIILDEPFTAIDIQTSETLLQLIQEWHKLGKTILVVLHDLDIARRYFPETILLSKTCLGWGKTEDVLTDHNLIKAYAQSMRTTHHA